MPNAKGLLSNKAFVYGVVAGIAATWAYHHFFASLPGSGRRMRKGQRGSKRQQQG